MIDYSTIPIYPEFTHLVDLIEERFTRAYCPPEQEIWDNKRLIKELNISVRTASSLRSKKILPYHKVEGLIFYLKSDVLNMLKKSRVESINGKVRIKTK